MESPTSRYVPNLSLGHLFARSWPLFKEHLWLMVGAFTVYALLTGGLGSGFGSYDSTFLNLVALVIAGPLVAGLYWLMLKLHRGEHAEFADLFAGFQEFGRALGVFVLAFLAVMVGVFLLIVPGIILAVGLWPALYLVMDDNLGVMDTLRRAWAMTRGYRWPLFVLNIVLGLVTMAGLLAFGIGFLFSGAFAMSVSAAAYEELARAGA